MYVTFQIISALSKFVLFSIIKGVILIPIFIIQSCGFFVHVVQGKTESVFLYVEIFGSVSSVVSRYILSFQYVEMYTESCMFVCKYLAFSDTYLMYAQMLSGKKEIKSKRFSMSELMTLIRSNQITSLLPGTSSHSTNSRLSSQWTYTFTIKSIGVTA